MKFLSKILKIILGIFIFMLIFVVITFFINKNRVKNKKNPLSFTMYYKATYADGGSWEAIGLGYKINKYCYTGTEFSEIIYEIGDYNLKFDKEKNKPIKVKLAEIFYEYYYDLGYETRNEEDNEQYINMVNECYENYIKIYGNNKDNERIETTVRDYFKLDDSYKLYSNSDEMQEKTKIIEESKNNQEIAIEILKKYNNNFEKVYEEVIEINKVKNYGPRDLEEKEIELYNIILDVSESKKITEEEKGILKKLIEQGYYYMEKDSNLKERADKILNN